MQAVNRGGTGKTPLSGHEPRRATAEAANEGTFEALGVEPLSGSLILSLPLVIGPCKGPDYLIRHVGNNAAFKASYLASEPLRCGRAISTEPF